MKIKTITGSSIHAALAEARRLMGDDVVLLESVPAQGTEPARISVMIDPASVQAPTPSEPAPLAAGYGYRPTTRVGAPATPEEENARPLEQFSRSEGGAVRALPVASPLDDQPHRADDATPPRLSFPTRKPGRGRLFPEDGDPLPPSTSVSAPTARLEQLLEAQFKLLHERLDAVERRLDNAVLGASRRWGAHPLFAALLKQGFRPATVASLFDSLIEKGFEPEEDLDQIRWALAHELRNRMTATASRQTAETQLFIGPSGAGKTSLVLKLVTHPNFFARGTPTVIVLLPEEPEAMPYQNPIDLYRRFGIPVQSVHTAEEMADALNRLSSFDQVLIDTPPLPLHEGRARKMLQRIGGLVDGLMPLEVQFVLNATRALDDFDAVYMKRLPLRPGIVALTHLDEVMGWGRIAEWLIRLHLPVRFVSTGPGTPDDLGAFSPTWFVERMMALCER